jgi:hypothetical protein
VTFGDDPLEIQRGDLPLHCPWPLPGPRGCCWLLAQGLVVFNPGPLQEVCIWDVRPPQTAVHCPDDLCSPLAEAGLAWRAQPLSLPLPAGMADIMAALLPSRASLHRTAGQAQVLLQAEEPEVYWQLRGGLPAELDDLAARTARQLDAYWMRDEVRSALQTYMPPGLAIALVGRLDEFRETLHWHWAWLHAERETCTVNDLQRTTPALANLLAEACATWPQRDYLLHLSWRLAGPQTELLQALGWPAEPWVARLLRRLRGPLCRPDLLRQLRLWLAQPRFQRALRDLPRWAAGEGGELVLEMLLCQGLSPVLLWRTLRGDPTRRRERLLALQEAVVEFSSLADVLEQFGAAKTLGSRKQLRHARRRLLAVAAVLPAEPLVSARHAPRRVLSPGRGFVRLNSIPELVQAGLQLGNCLASYVALLKDEHNDQVWLMERADPVAVLLRFDLAVQRWHLVEARGRGNREVNADEERALMRWLDGAVNCPK